MQRRKFILLLSALLLVNLSLGYFYAHRQSILGEISSTPPPVKVSASIDYRPTILIKPEKRIPPQHNDSLEITIHIRPENSNTDIYTTTVVTDNEGQATIGPITADIVTDQYYNVFIKGLSHLRRIFPHINFIAGGNGFTMDLRNPVLFAGDSNPNSDNYVNSLDISYEISKIYSNDLRADLNRDGIVNSLEFPTLISHLYQYGDN